MTESLNVSNIKKVITEFNNKFENYNLLCESNLGINFNEAKEVQVVDLINTICGTAEKNM